MSGLSLDRVVVVRALRGLGDFLCIVPALRALRLGLPQARITLIALTSSQALTARFSHYIDELLPFPGFPGIPEEAVDVTRLPAFFVDAQAQQFDLAIQMHGNGALMNPFTLLLGAKASAGYFAPGAFCPDPSLYLPLDESDHEVRRWIRLLEHLDLPTCGERLEFPLQQSDWAALRTTPEAAQLAGSPYIAVHPGASEPARRWTPEGFAAVADYLARDGHRVVLTGTPNEVPLAAEVERRMRYRAFNLAGRTSLGALAALLSAARLLVSNDTGVSHLATALGTPSVIVFLASDPLRWAPLDRNRHRVVGRAGLLAEQISPDLVLHEAYALLERAPVAHVAKDGRGKKPGGKLHQEGTRVSAAGS